MQNVLFIGAFGSGKATLINALIRKQILDISVIPDVDSCFVKQIVSGEKESCFAVNKHGEKEPFSIFKQRERLTADNFAMDHALKNTEYIIYESTAQANDLTFTIANPHMQALNYEYGQKILHSPCLQNDAVVYILNAVKLFTADDAIYIEKYLSDGTNKNLFFCIN